MGIRTLGQMGSADPLEKLYEKLKNENMQKKEQFSERGGDRERRYADHIIIQTYFRMHHFVVKFSKFSSPQAARGH